MKQKIDYLNKILKVYGFKNIFDFNTIVEKDEAMEKRFTDSSLLIYDNYIKMMQFFEKKIQKEDTKNLDRGDKITKLANAVLNEFGISIISIYNRPTINGKQIRQYKFHLSEAKQKLKYTIEKVYNIQI